MRGAGGTGKKPQIYRKYIKRLIDIACSAAALAVLSPVMLAVAVLVRLFLGKPVLFRQERPGLNGRIFKIYKFRSMTDRRGKDGALLPDGQRLPPFGKFLRSTSLDELPELFNILRGDMSIVGPRPLLARYLPRYSKEQARRHEVRPGLTGLAQVNGRNAITWREKFKWDVAYADSVTFSMDVKIILKTVGNVLRREGISGEGHVTMEEFMGNEGD